MQIKHRLSIFFIKCTFIRGNYVNTTVRLQLLFIYYFTIADEIKSSIHLSYEHLLFSNLCI